MKIKAVVKNKKPLYITTEYITLDNALKLAGIVSTGGQGKILISEGLITVNNQVCKMKGKKLKNNDYFSYERITYEVLNK